MGKDMLLTRPVTRTRRGVKRAMSTRAVDRALAGQP
jgi:hypothetical protein